MTVVYWQQVFYSTVCQFVNEKSRLLQWKGESGTFVTLKLNTMRGICKYPIRYRDIQRRGMNVGLQTLFRRATDLRLKQEGEVGVTLRREGKRHGEKMKRRMVSSARCSRRRATALPHRHLGPMHRRGSQGRLSRTPSEFPEATSAVGRKLEKQHDYTGWRTRCFRPEMIPIKHFQTHFLRLRLGLK